MYLAYRSFPANDECLTSGNCLIVPSNYAIRTIYRNLSSFPIPVRQAITILKLTNLAKRNPSVTHANSLCSSCTSSRIAVSSLNNLANVTSGRS